MACRAIGQGGSPFVRGRRCCTKPTAKLDFRSSSLLWLPRNMVTVGCGRVFCRSALPAASKEKRVENRSEDGDKMAEIGRSLLALSPVTDPLEVRRKEEASTPPPSTSAEDLDRWMKESVMEIVRNIQEAPFFVCLFSKKKGSAARLERELVGAHDRSWPRMKGWVRENRPDGIILVEELKKNGQEESPTKCSKLWGLLIQVRGMDFGACYTLKTTRECSAFGLCTHFCLIRAKCYGDPVEIQLRDSWLNLEL